MDEQYRGHAINVSRGELWHAVMVELATGSTLPTKATALVREGRGVVLRRARELVDVYIDGTAARDTRAA